MTTDALFTVSTSKGSHREYSKETDIIAFNMLNVFQDDSSIQT